MSKRKWIGLILSGVILCFLSAEAESNIILKTLIVNPSQTKTQTALLKAYLPKEAKPEDVLGLGDLNIAYDIDKSLYYVYREYELKPGESITRQIEIKDIWIISEEEIAGLNEEAKKLVEKLKKTAYFNTAITLQEDIRNKSNDILNRQEGAIDATPQTHIAAYRENIKTMGSVKSMVTNLEKMVLETKIAAGSAAKRVSIKATWGVILGVIIALGLLSFIFFIIWHRQATITETKKEP